MKAKHMQGGRFSVMVHNNKTITGLCLPVTTLNGLLYYYELKYAEYSNKKLLSSPHDSWTDPLILQWHSRGAVTCPHAPPTRQSTSALSNLGSLSASTNSHYDCYVGHEWTSWEPIRTGPRSLQQSRNRPFWRVMCKKHVCSGPLSEGCVLKSGFAEFLIKLFLMFYNHSTRDKSV